MVEPIVGGANASLIVGDLRDIITTDGLQSANNTSYIRRDGKVTCCDPRQIGITCESIVAILE